MLYTVSEEAPDHRHGKYERGTHMRRSLSILLCLLMLVSLCGVASAEGEFDKMAMATDVGGVNDESFNTLAWRGHQTAAELLGIEVSYIESKQEADYAPNLDSLLDAGNDLIWGIGFMMEDAVSKAAKTNPDTYYGCIDVAFTEEEASDNLIGITFKEQEASFLVGVIAGLMTETKKIGFIGGMDLPVIRRFHHGFEAGLKSVDPEIELMYYYAENFNDAALGKARAQKMYQDGADIVFPAAGATGNGAIEAAKELNNWVIGVDVDQSHLAPDNMLTSACKGVDTAILSVASMIQDGTFEAGNFNLGIAEGAVSIAETSGTLVPEDILAYVTMLETMIVQTGIEIPQTAEEIEPFLESFEGIFDEWFVNSVPEESGTEPEAE